MKKLEILFSEVCNLYGDRGNITLLKQCFEEENFVFTTLLEEPYFVKHKVDFLYLGPMSESTQERVIEKLRPYKEKIKTMIEEGVVFLFVGNAMEILGKEIILEDGSILKGLGIFDIITKRHPKKRYNSLLLGQYERRKMVGYISQSSTPTIKEKPFLKVLKEKSNIEKEGIHVKNFFGTRMLGPILVLNPYFTKSILKLLDYEKPLPYEEELIIAYEKRVKEYQKDIQY